MNKSVKFIVEAAMLAALYATLTLIFPFSFGHNIFQLRISEALTSLPAIIPSSIPGLFVGCIIANMIGGFGPVDTVLGSLATLLSSLLSYSLRKYPVLVPLPPVIINALVVGSYLVLIYKMEVSLAASIGWVALGQLLSCYGLGLPLLFLLKKRMNDIKK